MFKRRRVLQSEVLEKVLKIVRERSNEELGRPCTLEFIFKQFGVGRKFLLSRKKKKLRAEIQDALSQLLNSREIMEFRITHFYQETIHDKKLSIDTLSVEKSFWVSGYVPLDFDEVIHRCRHSNGKSKHKSLEELQVVYF